MKRSEAINQITKVLNESKIGVLSTSKDNIPNARYMWFYNDGLTLYAKTNEQSPKYEELLENPVAHVLLGFNDGSDRVFVEVLGDVEIVDDQKIIDWLWEEQDKIYFDNPENPDLTALKITPKKIMMMNDDKEHSTIEVNLEGGE